MAQQRTDDYRIYLSKSEDTSKNPLNARVKLATMKQMFPRHNRNILLNQSNMILDIVTDLYKKGYSGILKEISWNGDLGRGGKSVIDYKGKFDPNDYTNHDSVYEWLQYSDFYDTKWMPHIQQFESFEHLNKMVNEVNPNEISINMKLFNEQRKKLIYDMWNDLIKTKI